MVTTSALRHTTGVQVTKHVIRSLTSHANRALRQRSHDSSHGANAGTVQYRRVRLIGDRRYCTVSRPRPRVMSRARRIRSSQRWWGSGLHSVSSGRSVDDRVDTEWPGASDNDFVVFIFLVTCTDTDFAPVTSSYRQRLETRRKIQQRADQMMTTKITVTDWRCSRFCPYAQSLSISVSSKRRRVEDFQISSTSVATRTYTLPMIPTLFRRCFHAVLVSLLSPISCSGICILADKICPVNSSMIFYVLMCMMEFFVVAAVQFILIFSALSVFRMTIVTNSLDHPSLCAPVMHRMTSILKGVLFLQTSTASLIHFWHCLCAITSWTWNTINVWRTFICSFRCGWWALPNGLCHQS